MKQNAPSRNYMYFVPAIGNHMQCEFKWNAEENGVVRKTRSTENKAAGRTSVFFQIVLTAQSVELALLSKVWNWTKTHGLEQNMDVNKPWNWINHGHVVARVQVIIRSYELSHVQPGGIKFLRAQYYDDLDGHNVPSMHSGQRVLVWAFCTRHHFAQRTWYLIVQDHPRAMD